MTSNEMDHNIVCNDMFNNIPDGLKGSILHIRRCLKQKKAAVMVGAGFSKNAKMGYDVSMKDWNTLAKSFFYRLYSKEPNDKDLRFASPIRLASQLEAVFGRNELNQIITSSLPDSKIAPGELHKMLLNLPWSDVFTTNYDTLLERASISESVIPHYNKITNESSLLYEQRPRIIKLHGSFPDQPPFIITEEDYRTYPKRHPQFVNTVRQSMIENVFCLIGFSGEDPNFLNWLGWLRDVAKEDMSPVYWITYEKNPNDADVKLLSKRGIQIINLYNISTKEDNDYSKSIECFLKLINPKNEKKAEWSPKVSFDDKDWSSIIERKVDCIDKINNLVSEMANIRNSYPGWGAMPHEYYKCFDDVVDYIPYLGDTINNIDDNTLKLSLLYEIDWRLSMTFTPKETINWYESTLEKCLNTSFNVTTIDEEKIGRLKSSLLHIYRRKLNRERFATTFEALQNKSNNYSTNLSSYIKFQKALMLLSDNKFDDCRAFLDTWDLQNDDYLGAIWKTSILIRMADSKRANKLIQNTIAQLRIEYRNDKTNSKKSQSIISILSELEHMCLDTYIEQNLITNSGYNIHNDVLNPLISRIEGSKTKQSSYDQYHGFEIGEYITSLRLTSGAIDEKTLNTLRFLNCYEYLGFVWGTLKCNFNSNRLESLISNISSTYPILAVLFIAKSMNSDTINHQLSRNLLRQVETRYIDEIFDDLCNVFNCKAEPIVISKYIERVSKPILLKLCVKVSRPKLNSLVVSISKCASNSVRFTLQRRQLNNLKKCFAIKDQVEVENKLKEYIDDNILKAQSVIENRSKANNIDEAISYLENSKVSNLRDALDDVARFIDNAPTEQIEVLFSLIIKKLNDSDNAKSRFEALLVFTPIIWSVCKILASLLNRAENDDLQHSTFNGLNILLEQFHRNNIHTLYARLLLSKVFNESNISKLYNEIEKSLYISSIEQSQDIENSVLFVLQCDSSKGYKLLSKSVSHITIYNPFSVVYIKLIISAIKQYDFANKAKNDIFILLVKLYNDVNTNMNVAGQHIVDFTYYALQLAGIMYSPKSRKQIITDWKKLSEESETFNDVKNGFQEGLNMQKSS